MREPSLATYQTPAYAPHVKPGIAKEAGAFTLRAYVLLLVVHGLLGLVMHEISDAVALVHALGTLGVGVWAATRRRMEQVAYVAAYIVGAEVLWRMTGGSPVHEFGKYALVLLFGVALLRARRRSFPFLALLYFLLLLPSVPLTFNALGFEEAREAVSSTLSGPLALLMGVWFFSSIRLTRQQRTRLLLFLMLPVFAVAVITLYATVTAGSIRFTTASNRITSGGWGANQVSSVLGLGTFAAFLVMTGHTYSMKYRLLNYGLLLFFFTQAAMTFSRGGPYLAAGAIVVASIFYMRSARARAVIIVGAAVFFLFFNYVLHPYLDSFTEDAFTARVLEDYDTSGRDEIALTDLELWLENVAVGVGPGMSQYERWEIFYMRNRDHTEYTRLVAEHGIFGFTALMLLLLIALRAFGKARSARERGVRASLLGWGFAYMLVNGIRLVSPVFLIGLAFLVTVPDPVNRGE